MSTLFFGGSFNPLGNHHLMICQCALDTGFYEEICLIPCYDPPHKTNLAPYEDRAEMCIRATTYDGSPFSVSSIEEELFKKLNRKSYTIETVRELKRRGHENVDLLIGTDSFEQLPTWSEPEELIKEARFVLSPRLRVKDARVESAHPEIIRLEHPLLKQAKIVMVAGMIPVVDMSASFIRKRVARRHCIKFFVPPAVEEYIDANGLYLDEKTGSEPD